MTRNKKDSTFKMILIAITIFFIIIKTIMFFEHSLQNFLINIDIRTFASLLTLFFFFIFFSKYTNLSLISNFLLTTIFSSIAFSMNYSTIMIVNENISSTTFMTNFKDGLVFPMTFFGIYFFVDSIFRS